MADRVAVVFDGRRDRLLLMSLAAFAGLIAKDWNREIVNYAPPTWFRTATNRPPI